MAAAVLLGAAVALTSVVHAQFLPPGTEDVPAPRPGDCNGVGPATYVYRLSTKKPNDHFLNACSGLGGATVRFNDPCAWVHGQAQMTMAHFASMCKGATRTIHWHNGADEWGFVTKGLLQTFVASPEGLPWPNSNNVLSPKGVWYFPSGWLHGLMCLTPESEGGCEFYIVFASPQAAEPNGHNLDTTMAQAPTEVAAGALAVEEGSYSAARPAFAIAENASSLHSPIVTMVAPGACEPSCPSVDATVAAPAAVPGPGTEQTVQLSGSPGVTLYRIRTPQFPFARTMSQERTELAPGAVRPMVWATADAVLVVVSGSITVSLEGGILGKEAHLAYTNETLAAGDIAYFPNGRAYWFKEATGKAPAETVTVFNVGIWKSIEMRQSLQRMPAIAVLSNLHITHFPAPSSPVHV